MAMLSSSHEYKKECFDTKNILIHRNEYQQIFKSQHTCDGEWCILKCYKWTNSHHSMHVFCKMRYEFAIGQIAKHENLLEFLGYYKENSLHYIVFPWSEEGSLDEYLTYGKHFSEEKAFFIFVQVLEGLHYLHEQGAVHRDLKLENILIFPDPSDANKNIYKICSFGISNFSASAKSTNIGSFAYFPPEILEGKKYNKKIDYWTLGIVLFELLYGRLPWGPNFYQMFDQLNNDPDSYNEEKIKKIMLKEIDNFSIDSFSTTISNEAKELLKGLLQKDPAKRITYWNICNLPIYQKYLPEKKPEMLIEPQTTFKKNSYYKEKYQNEWVKNPIQKIIQTDTKKEYGIFEFNLKQLNENEINEIECMCVKEIQLSQSIAHPNILPLHDYYFSEEKKEIKLVYPCTIDGRLSDRMQRNDKLETKSAFKIFVQLADGLNELHENCLVYNNIRLENVIISSSDYNGKIYSLIGYGLSNTAQKLLLEEESLAYKSPEYVNFGTVSYAGDYWSLGILYYEMIKGRAPWKHSNAKDKESKKILKAEISSFDCKIIEDDKDIDEESIELLTKLLKNKPEERARYFDIKNTKLWKKNYEKKKGIVLKQSLIETPIIEDEDGW